MSYHNERTMERCCPDCQITAKQKLARNRQLYLELRARLPHVDLAADVRRANAEHFPDRKQIECPDCHGIAFTIWAEAESRGAQCLVCGTLVSLQSAPCGQEVSRG